MTQLISNHDLKNKTILLVNTGSGKKRFIIQKLKSLGLTLVILNKEKNWAEAYADEWILADTTNHQECLNAVKGFLNDKQQLKIDGVLTFWEDDVLLVSKICDRFNFIGIPYAVANKARNKFLFRQFCQAHGLPVPKYKLVKTPEDLQFVRDNFSFPLVIKPTYGSSSAYVVKVENEDELKKVFDYVKNNISTSIESALSDGLEILIEEYIDGDEVDVDMLLQNGKVKFSSVTDNYKTNEPFFIETGFSIPSSLPVRDQQALIDLAEETLEKMGVQNGVIHFEAKSTKSGPVPIEVNLRMGGDEVYSFMKGAWNVDMIENGVKIACGLYIKINKPEVPKKYFTGLDFLSDNSGILAEVDIDDQLKKKKYFEEMHFYKQIGDAVLIPPDGFEYLGWLTVSGDNLLDAEDNLEEAMKMIKYRVVKFDTASVFGKTSRKSHFSSAVLNKDLAVSAAKLGHLRNLDRQNLRKLKIGLAANLYEEGIGTLEQDLTRTAREVESGLKERGYRTNIFDFNNVPKAMAELKRADVDLVFNLCQRLNHFDLLKPNAAALLEAYQLPYTGSGPLALALTADKIRFKKLLAFHNIPTPKWDYAYELDDEIDESLEFPLIVKPGFSDNAIGVSKESIVYNQEQLKIQLTKIIKEMRQPALVEEFIEGEEYDVAILGSDKESFQVLPLARSIFDNLPKDYPHIYTYEAKWGTDPVYNKIVLQKPVKKISTKLETLITEIALDTYTILHCQDYGRVDIRVDEDDNPYVLEVNSNPSLASESLLASLAGLTGLDYADLLEEIIRLAIHRYQKKPLPFINF